MTRFQGLIVFLFFGWLESFGQLTADRRNINIGTITLSSENEILLPVFNQSPGTLKYHSVNLVDNTMSGLPTELNYYEIKSLALIPGNNNSGKFYHSLIFESTAGIVELTVKGRYKSSSNNQDCYDFKTGSTSKNSSSNLSSINKKLNLIRIYNKSDKQSLLASDPVEVPSAHLVILVDASGSMGSKDKLITIKTELIRLIEQLRPTDFVSIIRYSEDSDIILKRASCASREIIINSIEDIEAGGFTNGKEGIETAIDFVRNERRSDCSNNILMFTDGAFNFGSEQEEIKRFLLSQNRSLKFKFSVITVESNSVNNKSMKVLSESGNGYHFMLDKNSDRNTINKLLLKQLNT